MPGKEEGRMLKAKAAAQGHFFGAEPERRAGGEELGGESASSRQNAECRMQNVECRVISPAAATA
jgi:hypothetical protein